MESCSGSSVSDRPVTDHRSDLVLEAIGRSFFSVGFSRTGMDDLARGLGTSKKTIYRCFPDKHASLTASRPSSAAAKGNIS
jgi:AcrR family transcriptional regulator